MRRERANNGAVRAVQPHAPVRLLGPCLMLLVAAFIQPVAAQNSTSLLPNTDCDDLQLAFESCASNELSSDELGVCNFCMARAILVAPTESCDSLSSNVCTAIDSDCKCGDACKSSLEALMDCGMQEIFGCGISCEFATMTPSVAFMTTAAPTITASGPENMTNTQCNNAQDDLQTCFAANLNETQAETCNACVADAIPSPSASCNDVESSVCTAITECPCGPCRTNVQTILNCAFEESIGCTLACDLFKTGAPTTSTVTDAPSTTTSSHSPQPTNSVDAPSTATSSPSTITDCDSVQAALQKCYSDNLHSSDSLSCDACIAGTIPGPQETDCSVFQTDLCPALSTCGCEPCGQAVEDLLNCAFVSTNSCHLDCANEIGAPTQQPVTDTKTCDDARENLRKCFDSDLSLDEASSCDACVAASFPSSFVDCKELSDAVCSGIDTCSCGTCQSDVESFVSCSFQDTTECVIDCGAGATISPTQKESATSSTSAPTASVLDRSNSSRRFAPMTGLASLLFALWMLC
ncbi:hypothetical protein MPSEU_000776300 [Mayamaea pseudoterrestris]|nr:hypothetical protein MPSEU_000776300 [Mayamaea pseudoterrestris]